MNVMRIIFSTLAAACASPWIIFGPPGGSAALPWMALPLIGTLLFALLALSIRKDGLWTS